MGVSSELTGVSSELTGVSGELTGVSSELTGVSSELRTMLVLLSDPIPLEQCWSCYLTPSLWNNAGPSI
jgi:hypothetical protein